MALTQEQIKQIAAERGDTVITAPETNHADDFAKLVGYTPEAPKVKSSFSSPGTVPGKDVTSTIAADTVSKTAEDYSKAIPNFMNEAGRNDASTNKNPVVRVGENALAATASGVGTLFSPITNAIKSASDEFSNTDTAQKIANNPTIGKILDFFSGKGDELNQWSEAHPEAARNLFNGFTVGTAALGEKPVTETGAKVLDATKGVATDTAQGIKNTITSISKNAASKASEKSLNQTLRAINPELKGTKLLQAYKDTVKGNREINTGILKEQTLSPDERAIKLADRFHQEIPLQDGTKVNALKLTDNHVKNLDTLGKNLTETEGKLETALKGDPELNYHAQKDVLQGSLDEIKTTVPREFNAIKENKAVYDDVVNFAKNLINDSEDSITGLRDTRTSFDAQARKEYPNAFKNGSIDTKTPAGRAIKSVRDTMNEHLYNTAPNGSDIKALIGREADIFNATDSIAAKALKTEGLNGLQRIMKKHPTLSKVLVGITGYEVLKKVGIPLP